MSILVTGASGFIGGALVRRLAAGGREVHAIMRSTSSSHRLDGLGGVHIHEADLRDASAVTAVVADIKPRVIYHCAVYGGFRSQNDTAAIFDTNLAGTVNLLKACERTGFDLFINTGSSSEYGLKKRPLRETDLPEPVGDYGVAKCAATMFCRSEALLKGLPVVTLRLFSPYGPWDDHKRLIPYLIRTFASGDIPRLANPGAVRDYIHIDDVLDLYQSAGNVTVVPGEVYNAGSGRQCSIGEIAALLRRIMGGAEPVLWDDAPRRPEPEVWVADMEKTCACFAWQPQLGIEEGLRRTVEWFRTVGRFP